MHRFGGIPATCAPHNKNNRLPPPYHRSGPGSALQQCTGRHPCRPSSALLTPSPVVRCRPRPIIEIARGRWVFRPQPGRTPVTAAPETTASPHSFASGRLNPRHRGQNAPTSGGAPNHRVGPPPPRTAGLPRHLCPHKARAAGGAEPTWRLNVAPLRVACRGHYVLARGKPDAGTWRSKFASPASHQVPILYLPLIRAGAGQETADNEPTPAGHAPGADSRTNRQTHNIQRGRTLTSVSRQTRAAVHRFSRTTRRPRRPRAGRSPAPGPGDRPIK